MPNDRSVVLQGRDEHRKDRKENRKVKRKTRKEMNKEERKRKILMSMYSMLFRSPITVQVSSYDLGGFDRSGSPW